MQSFTFSELSERAQENVIKRYYFDSDYQDFMAEVQRENPDEMPTVSDWADACGVRFNEHGERVA